jgi:alpha-galactosidase
MADHSLLNSIINQIPGSLAVDGVSHRVAEWDRVEDPASPSATTITMKYRHPLRLVADVSLTHFPNLSAVEWRTTLRNDGATESGVLSDLRPLDLIMPVIAGETATVDTTNGSLCQLDDFLPWTRQIDLDRPLHLEPTGGRSSDGAMPFFTLETGDHSVAVAIGWSGQWSADIGRTPDTVRAHAGLANARLRLQPGEAITLPSFLLAVSDQAAAATNVLRAALERHVIPHGADQSPVTPLAHMTMSTFHVTKQVSERTELDAVRRAAELGLEAFWVDACWYGETPMWAEQVGNWTVRTDAFPRGLRPISDAAHAAGMKFVLWIEPERARVGTRLADERPELFLTFPDDHANLLLDLGNPEARSIILDVISGYISEFNVDIYRQDFNIRPLPAWQSADQEGREGIHQIRHVEGLYWLWDQLLQRHPGLVIDNCASGGRRIDLETLRRSVPLWRSDAADVGGGASGDGVALANQTQVSGLSRFVAQHTGPIWAFDPFHIRSAISSGFVVYCPLPDNPADSEQLRAAIEEIKRVRPALRGDFYNLIQPTLDQDQWSASQFHRPDIEAGLAVALRRPQSGVTESILSLQGLEPTGRYRVSLSPGYDIGEARTVSGADLASLTVVIPSAPGSVLVEYARLA